jgi:hypothetical protein
MGRKGSRSSDAAEKGLVMAVTRRVAPVILAAAFLLTAAPNGFTENVQPKDLLPKVAAYIKTFVNNFSNVVAEESYKQEIPSPRRKRQLKSDLMLVKYPGAEAWLVFRDTFEVDGKSVRSEPERLTKLFLQPPESALRRAREITSASEKYNLANIGTINNPLFVLALMQEENHDRFHFTLGNIEKSLGPDVRVLQFQEFRSPSLIKLDGNADVFTSGLLWVEQATGRVVKTQLNIGRRGSGIEIVTTFKTDPDLQIDVPAQLKEWYPDANGDITGEATYSHFRRFQVTTEQEIRK